MNKDFDAWNKVKKAVHTKPDTFGVHERELWWASLGVNVGVETDGKHQTFERPVLVIRKFNRQMVCIVPTTSRGKDPRFYEQFSYQDRVYFTMLTQLRTISTKRLLRKIGMMPKEDFEKVQQRCSSFFEVDENPRERGFSRRPKP